MHILIDYRPALRDRTGVGEYVHELSAGMLRQLRTGERVTLFSSSWKDRLVDVPAGAGFRDLRVPVALLNLGWHRFGWPPAELLGIQPDIAWSLHPLLMPSRGAVRAVTVHDLHFLDHPEHSVREVRRDYPVLAGQHARRADLVIVNSAYTRGCTAARLGIPEGKITVCYPGPPDWTARTRPAAIGPILHVGTVEPRKNVPALLDAYGRLAVHRPDIPRLVLAGKLTEAGRLLRTVAPAARSRIDVLGYVTAEQKQRLYEEASMLVIPSLDEGFGMPALEAMTVGLPVVAADRGALPEVLGGAGLLWDGASPESLAAVIARVLDEPALGDELSRRGMERARAFNWDRSAAVLLDAFRRAHERRRSGA